VTAQAGGANISAHQRPMAAERSEIRRRMRATRRQLPPSARRRAAARLAERLVRLSQFRNARLIAGYQPNDGEIDPWPALQRAVRLGKEVCLPAVDRPAPGAMRFMRYVPGDPLRENRYGIREPHAAMARTVTRRQLDLVLVPLVAFDADGNRLGMGGGYYDQHFAWRRSGLWRRPVLVGVAYGFQRVARIERAEWDVPLDAIVTESDMYRGTSRTGPPSRGSSN
jgi:5-formyltetrahydrofolate cyclo-ligase